MNKGMITLLLGLALVAALFVSGGMLAALSTMRSREAARTRLHELAVRTNGHLISAMDSGTGVVGVIEVRRQLHSFECGASGCSLLRQPDVVVEN